MTYLSGAGEIMKSYNHMITEYLYRLCLPILRLILNSNKFNPKFLDKSLSLNW